MFARFEQFLVSNGSIVPKQIPYYVKWVTDCYAVCKCSPDKILPADLKKQYLDHLENSREEWQVKQAEQACPSSSPSRCCTSLRYTWPAAVQLFPFLLPSIH